MKARKRLEGFATAAVWYNVQDPACVEVQILAPLCFAVQARQESCLRHVDSHSVKDVLMPCYARYTEDLEYPLLYASNGFDKEVL